VNYIELINNYWDIQSENDFSAQTGYLYFAVLDTFNRKKWKNPLKISNSYLVNKAKISEKTLIAARNRLQQFGFLEFESGKTNRTLTTYYLLNFSSEVSSSFSSEVSSSFSSASRNSPDSKNKHKQNETVDREVERTDAYFTTVNLEELQGTCKIQGVPPDFTESWWLHYEANGWLDGTGKRVVKPSMKILFFWRNKQHPNKSTNGNGTHSNGNGKPQTSYEHRFQNGLKPVTGLIESATAFAATLATD
jgi:hypothetical protein